MQGTATTSECEISLDLIRNDSEPQRHREHGAAFGRNQKRNRTGADGGNRETHGWRVKNLRGTRRKKRIAAQREDVGVETSNVSVMAQVSIVTLCPISVISVCGSKSSNSRRQKGQNFHCQSPPPVTFFLLRSSSLLPLVSRVQIVFALNEQGVTVRRSDGWPVALPELVSPCRRAGGTPAPQKLRLVTRTTSSAKLLECPISSSRR